MVVDELFCAPLFLFRNLALLARRCISFAAATAAAAAPRAAVAALRARVARPRARACRGARVARPRARACRGEGGSRRSGHRREGRILVAAILDGSWDCRSLLQLQLLLRLLLSLPFERASRGRALKLVVAREALTGQGSRRRLPLRDAGRLRAVAPLAPGAALAGCRSAPRRRPPCAGRPCGWLVGSAPSTPSRGSTQPQALAVGRCVRSPPLRLALVTMR